MGDPPEHESEDTLASSPLVTRLRELHAKAKTGTLEGHERSEYDRHREQILKAVVAAQGASPGGLQRRASLRVTMALKVEITFPERGLTSASTLDVSSDGFSALLAFGPGVGASARFSIRVTGATPVEGACRIASAVKQGTLQRVSFAITEIDTTAREALDALTFDHLLRSLP